MASAGQLKRLYKEYNSDVQFYLVYIREAHAIDSSRPSSRVLVEDPVTDKEREAVAKTCVAKLQLDMIPALLDRVDDKVNRAYGAHPDRLYLVGRDGKIAYAGGRGPRGFRPAELEDAILEEVTMNMIEDAKKQRRKK